MEDTNEMTMIFESRPVNEGLARIAAAAFCTQLNPTLEEVSDLKTAVSEAVTNCIIHGYEGEIHKIHMTCRRQGQEIQIDIADEGAGIENIEKAMEPLYTTRYGIYIHGSLYGSGDCGIRGWKRHNCAHEKNHREVTWTILLP